MQTCVSALSVPDCDTHLSGGIYHDDDAAGQDDDDDDAGQADQARRGCSHIKLQLQRCCVTLPATRCLCLAHDLFLLRCSDNSNAICVSHRLYSLHVSFSTFIPPFLLGYFWHVAATAAATASMLPSSDCLVDASIFNVYVNNPISGFAFPVFAFCPNKSH